MTCHATPTSTDTTDIAQLLSRLFGVIEKQSSMLTALSGGVDSTLVAAAARHVLGKANAPAAVGDSKSLPRSELQEVQQICRELDIDLHIVQPGEQDDPAYQRNDSSRCGHCKTHLYAQLQSLVQSLGIACIANGANVDDQSDAYRPGMKVAKEVGVVSPLIEAGLDKAAVRACALAMGLPNWDKPAAACLASRVPYGTQVTPEVLDQIEQAEQALSSLGFIGFRVRHHHQVARIELPFTQWEKFLEADMREQVIAAIKKAGYHYVTLDMEGFRSGSGNVVLQVKAEHTS